jgi:hypothetical protein
MGELGRYEGRYGGEELWDDCKHLLCARMTKWMARHNICYDTHAEGLITMIAELELEEARTLMLDSTER